MGNIDKYVKAAEEFCRKAEESAEESRHYASSGCKHFEKIEEALYFQFRANYEQNRALIEQNEELFEISRRQEIRGKK